MTNRSSPFSTVMVSMLFISPPNALTNFPAALGVPTPVSSTHQARGRGLTGVISHRPLKSVSAANIEPTVNRRNPSTMRILSLRDLQSITPGALRWIAIGAHPDDCEVKFGGAAARLASAGHAVKFVSTTNGDA